MSSASSPPPPPSPAVRNCHNHPYALSHIQFPRKPTTLPDLFLTSLSLLFLFSSSKPHTSSNSGTSFLLRIPFLSFPLNSRRFPKIPYMAHQFTPSKPDNHHGFASPQSLSDWLKPRLPSDSFASWGVKPGTKNIHNLWLELSQGEISLADSTPPIRTVNVVTVRIIGKDNRVLVESHQEMSDGSVRYRCRPLSEKMKPNETPEEAIFRAVKEELGSLITGSLCDCDISDIVKILPGSYHSKVEERNSVSYPGLPACYVLHSVDALVDGLPEGEFCTEEEEYRDSEETWAADKAISVKRHHWKWVSSDSVQS